ncbi:MAG TPA: hypothetical protein VIU12_08330 [Chryseolinea sp.]
MKIELISIVLAFATVPSTVFSQSIYFGYPGEGQKLKKGDLIILNVPKNLHGRFEETEQITSLVKFIDSNSSVEIKIALNVFLESAEYDKDLSESLAESLQKILDKQCKKMTYSLIAEGRSNPLFLSKESPLFRKMNTRMEILIE